MKATFALLADLETYNLVRSLSWNAHRTHNLGIDVARLEPHVSLKQPFKVENLPLLETYMDDLAASIAPFRIILTELQAIRIKLGALETGILWFDLEQTDTLIKLHHRLNRELEDLFGPSPSAHDGDEYHFHMTIAIGNQPFQQYLAVVESNQPGTLPLQCLPQELAMFVYEDDFDLGHGYMTFRKLPLGGKQPCRTHP